MQARVTQLGDVVVIHLIGRVDIEAVPAFRSECLGKLGGRKVVFDFRAVSFVGSTGIVPFIEAMQGFAMATTASIGFSGIGVELKKVLSATVLASIPSFDDAFEAARTVAQATSQATIQATIHATMAGSSAGSESVFLDRAPTPESQLDAEIEASPLSPGAE